MGVEEAIKLHRFKPVYLRNSSDEEDMCVNGVTTPIEFFYTVPDGYVFYLCQIAVLIRGATPVSGAYASIGELSTGLEIFFRDSTGVEHDLLDGIKIKRTSSFNLLGTLKPSDEPGLSGSNFLSIWVTLDDKTPNEKPIELQQGCSFVVRVNDDLEGLTEQVIMLLGVLDKLSTINNLR